MQLSLQRSLSYSLCPTGTELTTGAENRPTTRYSKVTVESVDMQTTDRKGQANTSYYYERCVLELKALRNAWLYEWAQLDLHQVKQLFASLVLQGLGRPS
eukprot:Em0021g283a